MASSNNAYASVQPLQGNVSDWLMGQEQMDMAKREEDRRVAAIEQAKKDREANRLKALTEEYNLKQGPPTGIKTYDEAIMAFYKDAIDKNHELYKKERSGQELTPEEFALKRKLQNLPETISLMTKAYQEQNGQYLEGLKTGKIKRDTDYELLINGMASNARAFLDREGNPVIGIDKDGDGNVDFMFNDFGGLNIKPNFVENVDLEKEIKAVADNLAGETKTTDTGVTKRTIEGLPLSVAEATASRMAVNPNGTLTPLAVSYFHDLGIKNPNDVTDEQLKDFEQFLTGRLLNSKERRDETNVDANAAIALRKEAKEEQKPSIGEAVEPTQEAWGSQLRFIDTKKSRSVPVNGEAKLDALKITDKDGPKVLSSVKIDNYTYDRNGNLMVDVSYDGGRITNDDGETRSTITNKGKAQATVSKETEARIAKMLGLTVEQMRRSAQVSGGAYDNLGQGQ